MQEERSDVTDKALKEILVALEQENSSVHLSAALNKVSVAPKAPQVVIP
jgi:hypothetical protein